VITLVDTEVTAARVMVKQNDAGEVALVIKRDVRNGRFDHPLNRFDAAKRFVRLI
jgi:TPP-dependent trihydroxycyclohexane-1,2-dione (THcHDO) dehydratase